MTELITVKTCRDCSRELPLSEFKKQHNCKFGVRPECKDCAHKFRLDYYQKTKEKSQAYSRQYRENNKEARKKADSEYQKQNRDKVNARRNQWRAENKERELKKAREYQAKHRVKIRAWQNEYHKQNPHLMQARTAKRRASLKNAPGSFTAEQWLAKLAFHGYRCYLCKESLSGTKIHLEHRIPISKNGTNWISNIAPSCADCNLAKSKKTEKEFKQIA